MSEPVSDNPRQRQFLRVYSVGTGAVLHSWSSPADQLPPMEGWGGSGGDSNTTIAWIGERALAFNRGASAKPGGLALELKVLTMSRPDGDLLGGSRTAATVPVANWVGDVAPFGCDWSSLSEVLITGDGTSYVCGGNGTSTAQLPKLYCLKHPTSNTVAFAGVSLAAGKLTRYLSGYRTGCYGDNVKGYPVWVNATGSSVIGYMIFGDKTSGQFGVFSSGHFRPLPYPVPGNSYQYAEGSLLNQVAW